MTRWIAKVSVKGREFVSEGTHKAKKMAKQSVADMACWWFFYGQMLEQIDPTTGALGPCVRTYLSRVTWTWEV